MNLISITGVETLEQAIDTALPIGVGLTAQLVRLTHPVDLEVDYEKLTTKDEQTGKFLPRFLPPPIISWLYSIAKEYSQD
jgi:hypothetical protein